MPESVVLTHPRSAPVEIPPAPAFLPLARGLSAFATSMLANPERLRELEEFLVGVLAESLERHRHEAADLIARTVARWDPEATSRRMELAVGRDLQFVRINGTLVGGLVGLLLYTIPRLL